MDDEQFEDLMFPINGIERSMEFELQPDRSTPIGLNVRGFEAQTQRQRGGSRAGIYKYIGAQVGGVSAPLQNISTFAFIDPAALLTGDDTAAGVDAYMSDPSSSNGGPGGGWGVVVGPIMITPPSGGGIVTSGVVQPPILQPTALSPPASQNIPLPPYPPAGLGPRTPPGGRLVRIGGGGVQPNRNVATPPSPPPTVRFVQQNAAGFPPSSSPQTLTLPNPVETGHLILVAVSTVPGIGDSGEVGITDSDVLNEYTQSNGDASTSFTGDGASVATLWWAVAQSTTNITVTITPVGTVGIAAAVLEYTWDGEATPQDDAVGTSYTGVDTDSLAAPSVAVNFDADIVVALMNNAYDIAYGWTPFDPAAAVLRSDSGRNSGVNRLYVAEVCPANVDTAIAGVFDSVISQNLISAISASFKPI